MNGTSGLSLILIIFAAQFLPMAIMQVELTNPDYGFTVTDGSGHSFSMDIPVDQGGHGAGFRPMQTLLAALCGCSAIDVVAILKKQRQQMSALKIAADGQREPGKEPSLWKHIQLRFEIGGDVDPSKAIRAVELSMEKYCSVAETLRLAGAMIEWQVFLNGGKISN